MALDSLENTIKTSGIEPLSDFRSWLQQKWYEHRDECFNWNTAACENPGVYFNKYKWWLKREYKRQRV